MQDPFVNSLLFSALAVWPYARILKRAGLNPWFSLLVFLPLVGQILVLAVLGHSKWPTLPPPPPSRPRKARVV